MSLKDDFENIEKAYVCKGCGKVLKENDGYELNKKAVKHVRTCEKV